MKTLYTLDSKNKIRVFECSVVSGVYKDGKDAIAIETKTGLLGGKLIIKHEVVTKGKQKRSIVEQAEFQARALWEEKLDEGYKALEHIENITKCVLGDQNLEAFIKRMFLAFPYLSYTNLNGDELPMLAHKFKDVKVHSYPYFIQPKLNGVRCLVKQDIFNRPNEIKLISRGGQYYQVPHIQKQLESLYDFLLKAYGHSAFILDGELYKHGVALQEISGAARKEVGDVLFASNSWLEYHIYDVINLNKLDEAQMSRLQYLTDKYHLPNIKFVSAWLGVNEADIIHHHDVYISEGYEGVILRKPDAKYEFNQRSKGLLKVKQYQDEEFEIIGSEVDTNKTIGESFVFILKNNTNNLTFKARPTGTTEQKEYWHNNPGSWMGKKGTVRFFERSKDDLPLQGSVQHKLTEFLHIRPKGE